MRKIIFLLTGLLLSSPALAEYRAYQLVIVNETTGSEKRILSTFDHIQYRGYFGLAPGEQVFYEKSWMCYGNTSYHKPICPPPPELPPATGQKTNSRNRTRTHS
ncbi:MAG: hypothetical protein KDD34_00110 [Bdellovibrionales bacterium]|nr:hypothetical protein [Bdellovibrionales bacterium]